LLPRAQDLERAIADKHEDVMTRFGAILASGILEAGGRNVTVQLMSTRGHKKLPAFVGMALFSNFW
jgi:26S proteasome regulatory subunit N2